MEDESDKRSEKKEVDLVEAVQRYLSDGSYPTLSSLNLKRAIRNKAKKFKLRRGELYYMNVKRGRGSGKVSMCQGFSAKVREDKVVLLSQMKKLNFHKFMDAKVSVMSVNEPT